MGKFIKILIFLLTFSWFGGQCLAGVHHIATTSVFADGGGMGVQPGDTVYLEAGLKPYLMLRNFQGSPDSIITIINHNGLVEISNDDFVYGLVTYNCRYFRLTGTGDSTIKYGIKITASNGESNGLSLDEFSSDFEVDHLEIYNTGFAGIMSKTNPKCDLSANRGNFTQYNTLFHDNFVHKTGGEGFYIGHSYYNGYRKECEGVIDTLYPHDIINAKIYNNIIDSTGYDGIQVGCIIEGCEVYGNVITNAGYTDNALGLYYGMSGIVMGGGTTGLCYNNMIYNGYGTGISVFGLGDLWIFNNLIVNAGRNSKLAIGPPDNHHPYGIFCDDRTTIEGESFNFINNTILNPRDIGIRIWSLQSKNNRMYNNLIINPGVKEWNFNRSMIDVITPSLVNADTLSGGNFFDSTAYVSDSTPYFMNVNELDFHPKAWAPNIDQGISLDSLPHILFDFDYKPRSLGKKTDAGVYEFLSLPDSISLVPISAEHCVGDSVIFLIETVFADSLYTFNWIFNDSILDSIPGFFLSIDSVSVEDEGFYKLLLSNGFDTLYSNLSQLTVEYRPFVFAGNDTTICLNYQGLMIQALAENYDHVLWETNGDGYFSFSDSLHTFYTPGNEDKANGELELQLTAFSPGPCDSVQDALVLTLDACTGIEEEGFLLKIYPNPAGNKVQITSSDQILKFSLSDMHGKMILEREISDHSETLNMSGLVPGIYVLQVHFKNRIEVRKIIHY